MNIAKHLASWTANSSRAGRLCAVGPVSKATGLAVVLVAVLAMPSIGQSIKKDAGGLGLDLSTLNVPEVPAEAAAPPKSNASESTPGAEPPASDSASSEIVEESVSAPGPASIPKANLPAVAAKPDSPISFVAEYSLAADGKTGTVTIVATISEPWHVYSVSQQPGGPKKTTLKVTTAGVMLSSPFAPNTPPTLSSSSAFPGVPLEEHHERVVWTAPLEVTPEFTAGSELKIKFDGLICSDVCQEIRETIVAKQVAGAAPVEIVAYRAKSTHADISAFIQPAEVKPGGQAELVITVQLDPQYHVYEYVPGNTDSQFKTLMVPTKEADVLWGKPTTIGTLHKLADAGVEANYFEDQVEWRIPVRVPADAKEGERQLEVALGFMTCTNSSCDPPAGVVASGVLKVVSAPGTAPKAAFTVDKAKSSLAAKQPNLGSWIDFDGSETRASAAPKAETTKSMAAPLAQATGGLKTGQLSFMTILFALMGGFILNFMPCVLPVIGLKVLGFVEQAGSSRGEIIKLNLTYVLGICAVMWALAGITVATQNSFGWGQQFTKFEFKLAMAALVFAMALSFLGVWEIPIPGFATSYQSNQLMQREGVLGAFSKGLFTTILATPCSGPFLGFVFAVTVTLDPLGVFVVYTMVGLGMGLPFLVLCLNPNMVKLLPKPGAWMETLKEALSFPLLLTVVYFVAAIGSDYRIATFSTLIAVWFACWLIGKVPIYADRHVKVKTWAAAIAVACVWGMISFSWLGPNKTEMPWQPYSPTRLADLRSQGKTVMIDFTANWCFNCKLNTQLSIEVPSVIQVVKSNGVVPLLADKTDEVPEIDEKLVELSGTNVIPFLVIYPADPKAEPIILNGTFQAQTLVEALKTAGPSKEKAETKLTSMRESQTER